MFTNVVFGVVVALGDFSMLALFLSGLLGVHVLLLKGLKHEILCSWVFILTKPICIGDLTKVLNFREFWCPRLVRLQIVSVLAE
jgi:hypothetical protein